MDEASPAVTGSQEPRKRQLTAAERTELRHLIRELEDRMPPIIRALDPTGMSHISTAQWNNQVNSLIASLKRMRRE
jgi:hypothetical protein